MQRNLSKQRRSDDEAVKESGLILDFDEIARKGSISREEITIAKAYGIYHSRQPGNHMARVVVPGGQLTSVEVKAIARLATEYGPGRISFTTRQAAQLHCLKLPQLPNFLRAVKAAGLTTFHGCGDNMRNVAACPWAAVCPHRVMDVLPHAREISDRLAAIRDLDNLPRKFKIALSGCEACCGQPYINCLGIVAVMRRLPNGATQPGFRVVIGGGMGWSPKVAVPLYGFVPTDRIGDVCRAAVLLHRDHGDRQVRMYARLKFVVERRGIDWCRQQIDRYLDEAGIDRSGIIAEAIDDAAPPVPARPLSRPNPQSDDGLAIQQIKIPKGEISAEHLAKIAELAEIYGDKHVYGTNRQNLELHGVEPRRLETLRAEIRSLGFETENFFGLSDVVSCVGTTYCPLAVSATHTLFDRLQSLVRSEQFATIADKVLVNITGCPNSCSPYRIADVGFRGLRVREQMGSTEGYQITIGGTQQNLGRSIGDFKLDDCVRVFEAVLDTFATLRQGDETLADNVARLGIEPYLAAVARLGIRYDLAVNPLELSVVTGRGETPLDLKTLERDVPCRAKCPANTNVPEYIRQIAMGRPDAAHRINQEDNVFPNILGRICTRPCESRCRYQWTSILGAVRICHLKRSAADSKTTPSGPLPVYFPPSGKKVAIVGAGPAGLAAARELKRYGHDVTVFERECYAGGQVAMGVPSFRCPREAIHEDIDAILQQGVEVRYGAPVDAAAVDALGREFDAVLLATGTSRWLTLGLEGLSEEQSIEGLRFLKAANEGRPLPIAGDVLIVGGGFTAVDCARMARRMLGPDAVVRVMYRRGEAQMAATHEEFEEMRQENIRIETLVTPVRAVVRDGCLKGVTFQRNILGSAIDGKKPAIRPVPDSDFDIPCGTLISAIGQSQDWSVLPMGVELAGGNATTRPGLFVAGDFSSGSGDVIHAAADGKMAADRIDAFLCGGPRRRAFVEIQAAETTGRLRDHDLIEPPAMPTLPLAQRGRVDEVELGFGPEAADDHAWRCYLCNHKFEIDQDKCIHCDWCIRVSPRNCILRLESLERDPDGAPIRWTETSAATPEKATYIWIDADQCIRCGNCYNICPVGAITVRKCDCAKENAAP